MTLIHSPARQALAERILANAEATAENLLIPRRDLIVRAMHEAEDLRDLATALRELRGREESTLNLLLKAAQSALRPRSLEECRDAVTERLQGLDFIIDALEATADACAENDGDFCDDRGEW